jgi:hypothetical protein
VAGGWWSNAQEALIEERSDPFERSQREVSASVAYRLYRSEIAPAGEDGEAREEDLLSAAEERVAPANRIVEGAVPVGSISRPAGEEGKPPRPRRCPGTEARRYLGGREVG